MNKNEKKQTISLTNKYYFKYLNASREIMRKIKIAHIQVLPILSGAQNVMMSILSGLDQSKYEIYVISQGDGPLVEAVNQKGWTHVSIKSLIQAISYKDFASAWAIFKFIRENKPDIIHTHSSKPGFIGRIVARLSGVSLVIHTVHGFSFRDFHSRFKKFFYIILESFAALFTHYNVFVNNQDRDFAIHKLGFCKKKSITIHNGLLPYEIQKNYDQEFFDNNSLNIVSTLRFSAIKNVISTIEQAVDVVKKFENISFTFYGDGELFSVCQEIILNNQAEDKVKLEGWIYNVQEVIPKYDVFLLNSLSEGLPMSILEAMSVGLPIISSNVQGSNELVDSLNGWLIDVNDKNGIESAVSEILKDKQLLREKGLESLNKVINRFSYELFINEYERLYATIFNTGDFVRGFTGVERDGEI